MKEVAAVCDAMSDWTGAKYAIMPPEDCHRSSNPPKWFIFADDIDECESTAHAEALWKDDSEVIWIESYELGDTTSWAELDYGEKGAIESSEMDLTEFSKPEVRRNYGNRFPIVYEYLVGYESILAEVSAEYGVNLQMRYAAEEGVAYFYMDAGIDMRGLDLDSILEKIRLNVKALAMASESIDNYEEKQAAFYEKNMAG